jgi:hypothetical protein
MVMPSLTFAALLATLQSQEAGLDLQPELMSTHADYSRKNTWPELGCFDTHQFPFLAKQHVPFDEDYKRSIFFMLYVFHHVLQSHQRQELY